MRREATGNSKNRAVQIVQAVQPLRSVQAVKEQHGAKSQGPEYVEGFNVQGEQHTAMFRESSKRRKPAWSGCGDKFSLKDKLGQLSSRPAVELVSRSV
jgi:hypothetical protein